jgi:aromatic ring-opening dioxygenase catalytic subunit (LigB family)
MGQIVGAALVSHVPPLVLPEAERRELNEGRDTTLVQGLHDLRAQKLAPLDADTVVVIDTHWFTTIEHIVAAHAHRAGIYTSEELPRGMCQMPYDFVGDPELANAWAGAADDRTDTWITAIDDPYLPIHYPTTNLLPFLQGGERWISAGICQTADPSDFLLFGRLLADAVAAVDRRVVVLASGGLSHRFWPLREFRDHEGADPDLHIRTPAACAADRKIIEWLEAGDHAAVLAFLPEFATHHPEGYFGHYLTMLGALGGAACTAPGTRFGEYESVAGTGQAHVWFDL